MPERCGVQWAAVPCALADTARQIVGGVSFIENAALRGGRGSVSIGGVPIAGLRERAIQRLNYFRLPRIAREVRRRNLSYLSAANFLSLRALIRQIRRERVPGDLVEYGVALGGSAIYLASELDNGRKFHGFDVFGMIPAPGIKDDDASRARYDEIRSGRSAGIRGDIYYGYEENLFGKVCCLFKSFGYPVDGCRVFLHRGLFDDTVQFSLSDRIAIAHVDCDWYHSVKLCLDRTADALSPGGFIVIDDYHAYAGCRNAADEFLVSDRRFVVFRATPHLVIRKRVRPGVA